VSVDKNFISLSAAYIAASLGLEWVAVGKFRGAVHINIGFIDEINPVPDLNGKQKSMPYHCSLNILPNIKD
jgi:hypothetical protein